MTRLEELRDELRMDTYRLRAWLVLKVDPENEPFFSESLRTAVEEAGAACRIVRRWIASITKPEKKFPAIVVVELNFLRSRLIKVVNAIMTKDPESGVVVLRTSEDSDFALEMLRAGTRLRLTKALPPDLARGIDAPFIEVTL